LLGLTSEEVLDIFDYYEYPTGYESDAEMDQFNFAHIKVYICDDTAIHEIK
jgi:hypothetical protein